MKTIQFKEIIASLAQSNVKIVTYAANNENSLQFWQHLYNFSMPRYVKTAQFMVLEYIKMN